MNRRARLDVVIVGGGVVGAACALALADAGLAVALVEGREPAPWQASQPDLRVFAFAADNVQLLDRLGVWPAIVQARAWPYRRMQVWDAAGRSMPLTIEPRADGASFQLPTAVSGLFIVHAQARSGSSSWKLAVE